MRLLSEESISQCFNFLTEYYLIKHEVRISVAIANNDMEWKKNYTCLAVNRNILDEWLRDKEKHEKLISLGVLKEPNGFERETHIRKETNPLEEWRETSGYHFHVGYFRIYLAMDKRNRNILEKLKGISKGSKWFIFLRDMKKPFWNLVNLLHEMLHIIEDEGHYHIFRGSSSWDEKRDTKEIVIPLVKKFLERKLPNPLR